MLRKQIVAVALCIAFPAAAYGKQPLTLEAINAAQYAPGKNGEHRALTFKAQVLLDRAGFSPGVIDARDGENYRQALNSFQQQNGLNATGKLDEGTWAKLSATSSEPAAVTYTIAKKDVQGPFVDRIPKDYEQMAELDRLAYHSPRELLAERFHMDEDALTELNKGKDFAKPETSIVVANVEKPDRAAKKDENTGSVNRKGKQPREAKGRTDLRVEVNKSGQIAYYPASVGSDEKPAPSGVHEVRAIAQNPTYRYNPDFKFKGQKAKEPVEIAPGPNNPVGAVWIALSADTYGIHGTPHPEKVGKVESHGCVRLTNWDALALAKLVKKGTRVEFVE
jgi:lipoprotein-anchoring transpeptidase ErfK/SrfK